ncbi:aminotransferase class V-fold PLP-dependent enzyme [Synechococcus sp. PCC 7336]|uniref:aminotransferase class V-fold PLP-dependent enzyme n=1 Tax=Synechococcus sp. PCC 7336 TaxID=195250 RepID=UPI000344D764|nr:aminotransferase class V-fold PLP-dependent enzyme [Synechococcus sp. PCC 7336]
MPNTLTPLSLAELRQQFPALADKTYFNFGGQGPLSAPAREAIAAAYRRFDELGPFSVAVADWLQQEQAQLRQAIATYLATTPDRIAFTESTLAGMNIPMWGLDWRQGDRLLLSDAEHYGVWEIATALRDRFGIELDTCPLTASPDPADTLEKYLKPNTRMACISHVFWNSGRVMPLQQLSERCRARGALLHVDAAQSAGVLPLDLPATGADFYAFTGHKWLCGPAGTGALYLSERGQAAIRPTFTGWCKTYAKGGAEQFEVSTAAYPVRIGLAAALQLHDRFGTAAERYGRQVEMARSLWQQLQEIPGVRCLGAEPPEAGLVPFAVAGKHPEALELALERRGVYVRSMVEPVSLRASVHYFTTAADIDRLLAGVRTLAV